MVDLEPVLSKAEQEMNSSMAQWHSRTAGGERQTDEAILHTLVQEHFKATGSFQARELLKDWDSARAQFVKVIPREYRRALSELWQGPQAGKAAPKSSKTRRSASA
jgi:glutamate synthase (NADPH/NADH) large chain